MLIVTKFAYCASRVAAIDVREMGPDKRTGWPNERLKRPTEKRAHLSGMAAGRSADELFLADSANNAVRAFNTSTGQLDARDVYRGSAVSGYVESVAYSAPTDTLIICSWRAGMLRHRAQSSIVRAHKQHRRRVAKATPAASTCKRLGVASCAH